MYDSKQSNSIIHACHKWSCFFFFFFFLGVLFLIFGLNSVYDACCWLM
jgi:hypothetical protein